MGRGRARGETAPWGNCGVRGKGDRERRVFHQLGGQVRKIRGGDVTRGRRHHIKGRLEKFYSGI